MEQENKYQPKQDTLNHLHIGQWAKVTAVGGCIYVKRPDEKFEDHWEKECMQL